MAQGTMILNLSKPPKNISAFTEHDEGTFQCSIKVTIAQSFTASLHVHN
jgi:hypothetical protein